jgi:hypothetical protein
MGAGFTYFRRPDRRRIAPGGPAGISTHARTGRGAEMDAAYDFRLILDGVNDLDPQVVDALYEAGCDDGTLGCRSGVISMGFTRSAPTMLEAIQSAIRDVQRAGIGARVVRVDPEGPDPDGDAAATNAALRTVETIDPRFGSFVVEQLKYRDQLQYTH